MCSPFSESKGLLMAFNSVHQYLKELFPQVDARILKAVAIEHSKDPNGALEAIYTEVLPFINGQSEIPSSAVENNGIETTSPRSLMPVSNEGEDANTSDKLKLNNHASETLDDSLPSAFYNAKDIDDHLDTRNLILSGQCQGGAEADGSLKSDSSVSLTGEYCKDNYNQPFGNQVGEDSVQLRKFQDIQVNEVSNASFSNDVDLNHAAVGFSNDETGHLNRYSGCTTYDCKITYCRDSTEQDSTSVNGNIVKESYNEMSLTDSVNQEFSCYIDVNFEQKSHALGEFSKDDPVPSTIVTRSGQVCEMNLLQEIVEDAKNYKDTLLSAMESVTSLIHEVELREKEAQDAKEAASRGGLEILEKVEELKRMLVHAKEANDMHAGEVYGEKSILATEVRELQTRVLNLSDEKDRSLCILDGMRETLEARLLEAEEEKKAAEQELYEKQENARGALAEQELIMEKVVQESKNLQQEAEENAKLRDFLMDKGHLVDVLQGEISVICQDVKLLKEKFDNRVSFSKPLSLRQTSCHLSSSNSSVKSMASDVASGLSELPESPLQASLATSIESQTPRSTIDKAVVEAAVTPQKELLDEDWELFDF